MKNSALFGANAIFIEELYRQFLNDPHSVDESWHKFFSDLGDTSPSLAVTSAPWKPDQYRILNSQNCPSPNPSTQVDINDGTLKLSLIASQLTEAYQRLGHTAIIYDPIKLKPPVPAPELQLSYYGLNKVDLDKTVVMNGGPTLDKTSLGELLSLLQKTYANRIGAEFIHVGHTAERQWLQEYIENSAHGFDLTAEERKEALFDLTSTGMFEEFLHKKFPGAKRFSIEGGEATIASINHIINHYATSGGKEVILAMAHRGRLSTLTRVMNKPYRAMFAEFAGKMAYPESMDIPGDVKYHLGFSSDRKVGDSSIHLSLMPNPSHLELVNSVALGKTRAKQDISGDHERSKVLNIAVHGDAAFAGQGSVSEALSLSQLQAYCTGGTIHLVINNQVGFTTNPNDSRSSRYCTDVAKMINAPIFHISGDDTEAILFISKLAVEYRTKFKKDIVLDIVCYRKYGHNEGDEPMFTQPSMYKEIANHESPYRLYAKQLATDNIICEADFQKYQENFHNFLEDEFLQSKTYQPTKADWLDGLWGKMNPSTPAAITTQPKTGVAINTLKKLANTISEVPNDFTLNSKISRQLKARKEAIKNNSLLEWGTGEALAMATLLQEGYNIRISGQDVQRGTFSHRHAVLIDQINETRYCPLNNINAPGKIEIYNSSLSELAVMGFEYGYSITAPNTLTIWEAQFGDFANSAQMMIDQYVTSGEAKWLRMSGLVLLLPHGYEGQGPEHSSARLERYLQLCAQDNIQVLNCSTPASLFHALRRQMHRDFRKPLIIMSPKSLLRKPLSILTDMQEGTQFMPVILDEDKALVSRDKIKRVIFCSGKVYYDLLEKRKELDVKDIALIRLEQLYPFPQEEVADILKAHPNATVAWGQEEHKNMGAYNFISPRLRNIMKELNFSSSEVTYIGREESASPSAGYATIHQKQLDAFLLEAFK